MLVQIHSGQVPKFWEIIKFSALNSDNILEEYRQVYCYNLLQDLLSGKKYCFIGKKDGNVTFVIILSFKVYNDSGMKYLYFNNIYSFFEQDDNAWQEVFIDMGKIAKEAECKAIIGDSSNEKVHSICMDVGATCSSHKYEYYL